MGFFGKKPDAKPALPKKEMWVVQCGPECRFRLEDQNKAEATQIVLIHNKLSHKTNLTEAEAMAELEKQML